MSEEKIAIIGGGSAYVPGIVYCLIEAADQLAGSEIVLMDIDPGNLPLMRKLAERMANESGANIRISTSLTLEEALPDATFVLTNFRPGGLESLRLDQEIPLKYGVIGQETCGPGGTFFALRSIPQVLDLCRAMETHCPDAWLINYVNPANFVQDAITRLSSIRSVSICDGGGNALRYALPRLLELEPGTVRPRAAGINHHTWLMGLRTKTQNGYPLLKERLEHPCLSDDFWHEELLRFGQDMIQHLGLFPANGHYLFRYFHYQRALEAARADMTLYHMFLHDLPIHWDRFRKMAEGTAPIRMDPAMHHTEVGHGDIAVSLLLAIATNTTTEFHVNIPNRGAISNLPADAIVEVPALVDSAGVRPLCMGDLPACVHGFTQQLLTWQQLSVDAALSGNRETLLQALWVHPWVNSLDTALRIRDELLEAHAAFLPQFS